MLLPDRGKAKPDDPAGGAPGRHGRTYGRAEMISSNALGSVEETK